ncbi:MAG: YbjQ family protein [Bacteroides sp.]|nr:YbjQ family protein [Bacteroides sp.]MCM1413039.1 YbjQ family protein [Bacteroides sp.]MCM1471745.1 YbjQ family protein [Bacteroides sp.]
MANIFITTAPILSNIEIQRYICPLTANVVLGVNFFADFAASITDIIGGNSDTYQSKLDTLTDQVCQDMKNKAIKLGANAIIDYKLQFNEISGKGKQMFMVTATGTACVITKPISNQAQELEQTSFSDLRRTYLINAYRRQMANNKPLKDKSWENIYTLNLEELLPELTKEYFTLQADKSKDFDFLAYKEKFCERYEEFLSRISSNMLGEYLLPFIYDQPTVVESLIIKYNLFDPDFIIELIKNGNVSVAINLLKSHKSFYTKRDLEKMREILCLLESLPDKGSTRLTTQSGLFSKKEEELYICPNGHKNQKDNTFCVDCGLNIKGLTLGQLKTINQFKDIVEALAETLNKVHSGCSVILPGAQ